MITVLCYKKCTTCQKAFKWLDANGVEYKERAIKEENPTYEELKTWYEKSGLPLKKFFNTSGQLYKTLQLKDKIPAMSEEEQFAAYKKACEIMQGKPVIIRTLDIGGDKEVPALALEKEQNPFLGYRAIRICLNQPELFLIQLRALLRAAQYGDLRIMFPMISSVDEVRGAKQVLEQAKDMLTAEGVPFNPNVKVGIMVEIPVAAVCADVLAKEVDFFSIGTNDLIQYSCAVDRINEKISYLYRPLHPGVLRLIAMTAKAANENGIEVGVCGEMAGTAGMAPVLCGLGVTNLSMSASAMLAAKADLAKHSCGECKELADKLLACASASDAERIFADWRES